MDGVKGIVSDGFNVRAEEPFKNSCGSYEKERLISSVRDARTRLYSRPTE